MDKSAVIKALQIGLDEAIRIIEHLKAQGKTDSGIEESLLQLKQLQVYSEHVHDEHPSKNHPLYDN